NPRYADIFDPAVKGVFAKEAQTLQDSGYATDPNYAKNLISIPNGRTFKAAITTLDFHAPNDAVQLKLDYNLSTLDQLDQKETGQSIEQIISNVINATYTAAQRF